MLILGIETSCDETAASVLEASHGKIKILSSVVASQINIHKKYGGVVPEVAARMHTEVIFDVIAEALKQKNKKTKKRKNKKTKERKSILEDIDLIAATYGPGLVTSLRVGVLATETLANLANIPFAGVNHIEAHLLSPFLTPHLTSPRVRREERIVFPALGLVVSGGHTELILMKDFGKYRLVGSTRDDAVGEAFDKVAKILGLGYPGGPAIAAAAKYFSHCERPAGARQSRDCFVGVPSRNDIKIKLPRPMLDSGDFDFSFSGLKTAVLYLTKKMTPAELKKNTPAIAAEFQQAAIDVLVYKTKKAAEKYKVKSILVGGGVSANHELRNALAKLKFSVFLPEMKFTGDNAAMIAFAGYKKYQREKKNEIFKITAEANLGIR
ncbi:MAG: tRNA (adenosine(37)-N6)-threonylcarbamoyltransferase complex transferase subunit TsaD [bacterium]